MGTLSLTGADTISLDITGTGSPVPLVDLGDGDNAALTFPNSLTETKKGKNGNGIIALNETGDIVEMTVRILRGSPDDKNLNSRLRAMKNDFSSFVTISGEVIKAVGDGLGNVSNDIYTLSGGTFSKRVEVVSNVEGNTDQALAIYTITFVNSDRKIA